MKFTPHELRVIVANGAGLILDARQYSVPELKLFTTQACTHQGVITLRNVGHIAAADLVEMASNSRGLVVFDLCEPEDEKAPGDSV